MSRLAYYFSSREGLLTLLITIFCVFLSLTIHEVSHGFMAYLRGDNTAKYTGRLSFNPINHIDPLGALCLFLFGFGWAKPVMINTRNFKTKTIKLDMVLTSLAGPISNFIVAFISVFLVVLIINFTAVEGFWLLAYMILQTLAVMNVGLGIFNLIPIPPLDGSKVLSAVLPTRLYFKLMQYERFGFIALIIIINLPIFSNLLNLALTGTIGGFYSLSNLILELFI
ncbi:MAG: site-2 protease family protein [Clostridia bacterium]|nr:site-2 protease family protein [Clostridia bacterium]